MQLWKSSSIMLLTIASQIENTGKCSSFNIILLKQMFLQLD